MMRGAPPVEPVGHFSVGGNISALRSLSCKIVTHVFGCLSHPVFEHHRFKELTCHLNLYPSSLLILRRLEAVC